MMISCVINKVRRRRLLWIVGVLIIAALAANPARARSSQEAATADLSMVLGTWTGSSTCVGNRPACKNEEVVYRFVKVEGKPDFVTLLADKIIEGKRVPMGKLEFHYVEKDHSLNCEFRVGRTHGLIELVISGETMTGTLLVLPEKTDGRRINVHRVREDQVPKPPALEEYAE